MASTIKKGIDLLEGWKKPFYAIGWLAGWANPLFWLIQIIRYNLENPEGDLEKLPFFNKKFHEVVWIYGAVALFLFICALLFSFWQ